MCKIRVRGQTALALCVWMLSVSWISGNAVAGSEGGGGALVATTTSIYHVALGVEGWRLF